MLGSDGSIVVCCEIRSESGVSELSSISTVKGRTGCFNLWSAVNQQAKAKEVKESAT